MGQKSGSETVIRIFQAFVEQQTWRQPELAERVGLKVHSLRRRLDELVTSGVPLERDQESPTEVFWSVPKNWLPGGAYFTSQELELLLRLLVHMPPSEKVERLQEAAARSLTPKGAHLARLREVVVPPENSSSEFVQLFSLAAAEQQAVWCRYYSPRRGELSDRIMSPQRVWGVGKSKVLAVCHRSDALRYFRLDRVAEASLTDKEAFRPVDPAELEEIIRSTVAGFHDGGQVHELSFRLLGPDARWVRRNLPPGMTTEVVDEGYRVTARTGAVDHVARYVVSLGHIARPETPRLIAAVRRIAQQALDSVETAESDEETAPSERAGSDA